jgi:N-acetylglucosamine malate deacetylase 1
MKGLRASPTMTLTSVPPLFARVLRTTRACEPSSVPWPLPPRRTRATRFTIADDLSVPQASPEPRCTAPAAQAVRKPLIALPVVRASRFERALCVAAHPDDEVLGAGATLASLADGGCEVHVVVLGEGVGARYEADERPEKQVRELAQQLRKAASILGAVPHHIGLPDNRFDSLDLLDVVKLVEEHRDEVDPDLILTHHAGDLNVDHRVTSDAVLTAFRPVPESRPTTILGFETLSSTEWSIARPFWPNWFEDASPGLGRKLEAMAAYQHELRQWPHPRSLEGVRAAARRWGMTVGREAAEAFTLLRRVCF